MANKNYGLTSKPNEHIKDKSTDWMEDFFKKPEKKADNEKEVNAFAADAGDGLCLCSLRQ